MDFNRKYVIQNKVFMTRAHELSEMGEGKGAKDKKCWGFKYRYHSL